MLIETHGALRDAWEIAALDRVKSLDFGLMDFVSGHHGAIPARRCAARPVRAPAGDPRQMRHRGRRPGQRRVPSHNVTTELQDIDYIRRDAERARKEFGYLRMWSIHPNQIVPIIEAMRPDHRGRRAARHP